FNLRCMKR
ncbi:diguanylate cyclase domain protein, partial [Vibrio parahaemolyticus V-223/04]